MVGRHCGIALTRVGTSLASVLLHHTTRSIWSPVAGDCVRIILQEELGTWLGTMDSLGIHRMVNLRASALWTN